MKTPGFSAEVVLDPAIQNKHYGGLFAETSDQGGVIPQLMMSDIWDLIDGLFGRGGGGAVGGAAGGAVGGAVGGPVGAGIGAALGTVLGREVHCLIRTGKFCD